LGVSRQGEFKNTTKMFLQKVHVEDFSQNFDKKFRCQCFLDFFVLSRFRVFLSDGSSKTLQKAFNKKNRVEKQKTLSRFWAFLDEGVQKHDKKNIKKINLTLVLFRTLTHPPTTGVPDFFFCRPLGVEPEPEHRAQSTPSDSSRRCLVP
jgi:hypothetical protein